MTDSNVVDFPMNDMMKSFLQEVNVSPAETVDALAEVFAQNSAANELVMRTVSRRADSIAETHRSRAQSSVERLASAARKVLAWIHGKHGDPVIRYRAARALRRIGE